MSTQSILTWVACVTANLLPSQSATLAALVVACGCKWVNLATIGCKMAGPTPAYAPDVKAVLAQLLVDAKTNEHNTHSGKFLPDAGCPMTDGNPDQGRSSLRSSVIRDRT